MYNFDEIIDRRNTNALNTDGFRGYIFHAGPEKVFPYKDEEFVRMWVADMEFAVAPEILDSLRQRIDRRIFGYTGVYDDGYGAWIATGGRFLRSSSASPPASSRPCISWWKPSAHPMKKCLSTRPPTAISSTPRSTPT